MTSNNIILVCLRFNEGSTTDNICARNNSIVVDCCCCVVEVHVCMNRMFFGLRCICVYKETGVRNC